VNILEHYTLNTGHSRNSARVEVGDEAIALLRPMLAPGRHPIPFVGAAYALEVPAGLERGWVGTVYRGQVPLATIGVAADEAGADEVWPALEGLYLTLTDRGIYARIDWSAPRRPTTPPWCAVVMVSVFDLAAMGWLGDFERCLAWTWIDAQP